MRRKHKDLTGIRFGRWLVLGEGEYKYVGNQKRLHWKCQCDCGTIREVVSGRLCRGASKSCGCLALEILKSGIFSKKHGMWNTRIWNIWKGMHNRCKRTYLNGYHNYGGRGIKVCDRWKKFENFLADMGDTYEDGLTIDRKDNDGNYEHGNCHWITHRQQQRNRRNNHNLTFEGKTQCITAWAEEIGIKASTLISRIDEHDWSTEKALTAPLKKSLLYNGKTIADWSRETGIKKSTLRNRLSMGWSVEKTLTHPI
jgi:lambda repressor-like predicted transcriptional regulator